MNEKRFFADAMLGNLSRFLRILGFDTHFRTKEDVQESLKVIQDENRILLTCSKRLRDIALKHKCFVIFLEHDTCLEQLKKLKEKTLLEYEVSPEISRCSLCNGETKEIDVTKLGEKVVPEGTLRHTKRFWQCINCQHIFWEGRHWVNIKKHMDNI